MKSSASSSKYIPISLPESPHLEVTIGSLGGLGDGIADVGGKPLFVSKSCTGDVLKVRIVNDTVQALRGEITEIITSGKDRQIPSCRYFSLCGGCNLQHLNPTAYHNFKTHIFHSALRQAGFDMPEASVTFITPSSRRRVELRLHHENGRVKLAYFLPGTRDLLPIEECLILSPALQAFLKPLGNTLSVWPGKHNVYSIKLTEVSTGIDICLMLNKEVVATQLSSLAETLDVSRLSAALNKSEPRIITVRRPVEVMLGEYTVSLPPDSFLQATAEGQSLLVNFIMTHIPRVGKVADLFSGIGTYSFALLKHHKVHAVESHAGMVQALKKSAEMLGVKNLLSAECRDLFKDPLGKEELSKFDSVVINPPRPGAKRQMEAIAASSVQHVVMISCNPATFARDAKVLKKAGFVLKAAEGIDQFVYSPHLEIAAAFSKSPP